MKDYETKRIKNLFDLDIIHLIEESKEEGGGFLEG